VLARNISKESIEFPGRGPRGLIEFKIGATVPLSDDFARGDFIQRLVRKGLLVLMPNRTRFEHINEAD